MSLSALLAVPLQLAAAVPPAGPTVYDGASGQLEVRAPRLAQSVDVDGRLDEPAWREAAVLTGFSLYQPVDQRRAPDSTEVLVWYSATAIHFGVRAFEPHGAVRATLAERDRVGTDDNVEIHLDTFDERRRALVFIVNALGVQADGTKSEGGGFIPGSNVSPGQNDLSADFTWQSKGRVTEWGYEVELRVPFSSIRYAVGARQRWGLQVVRNVQHSGYQTTWTPARRGSASFIAQAGHLTGLEGMRHGQVVDLNPELTSTMAGAPAAAPERDWRYGRDARLGGNVRWAMGSDFVLNGTVRPDFSQVEADATQIATDPRFALFYPERRPFFVEGSDQFNVPNTLVYTRRIVSPEAAAKLTGKVGRTDVALLTALDDAATTSDRSRPFVGIARLRRDFGEQSTAGLLYSARASGRRDNQVFGGDARVVFGRLYYAQLQAVQSVTVQGGVRRAAPMWEGVVDRTGRNFGFHYALLGVAPGFETDNGFVSRTGFVQPSVANRFTVFGRQGGLFERYNVFTQASALWRYDDFGAGRSRLEHRLSANNQFTLRRGWAVSVNPTVGSYGFDPAAYAALRAPADGPGTVPFAPSGRLGTAVTTVSVATPQFRRFAASVGGTFGRDVDFLETSRVQRRDYNASLDLRPSERLRVGATYLSSALTRARDGGVTLSTRIPRVRVEYQVARPVLVRVVSQYEAGERAALRDPRTGLLLLVPGTTPGTYVPSAARAANALRTDWLFSYRPTPGTVFFAGYGTTLAEPDPLAFRDLRRTGDALFVKLSYLFRIRPDA